MAKNISKETKEEHSATIAEIAKTLKPKWCLKIGSPPELAKTYSRKELFTYCINPRYIALSYYI